MTSKEKLHSILLVLTALILFLILVSSVASAFPVTCNVVNTSYKYDGWSNGKYPLINLLGQKYVPLLADNDPIWKSHANKLSKLILDSSELYTLRAGNSLDLGQGYAIEAKDIKIGSKNMFLLEFTKYGVLVDDEIFEISAPRNSYPGMDGQRTWEVKLDNIQGEDDVVVLKAQVRQVFQGAVDNISRIDGIWLIDYANTKVLQYGDKLEGFKLINITNGLYESNLGNLIFESGEVRLSQDGVKAIEPAIYGDKVVWSDHTGGLGIIHLYNLTTGKDIKIGFSSASRPAIYDNKIVWLDNSNGNPNLRVYDTLTSASSQITKNVTRESVPEIYGNIIVWRSNGNFYMSDISASTQTQITNGSSQFSNPDIYGDRIVYEKYCTSGELCIYLYNISTQTDTMITWSRGNNPKIYSDNPKIYGDKIIWTDNDFGNDGLWMYDLATNEESHLIDGFNFGRYYEIYGDRIVRIDDFGNGGYLYLYNISTSSETRMTSSRSARGSPAIYGDRIVWEDEGIYMCDLSPDPNAPVANFSSNVTEGYAPLIVQFNDISQRATSRIWDFNGDGQPDSNDINPIYEYASPGTYTVNLTVSNTNGTASKLSTIKVSPAQRVDSQFILTETRITTKESNKSGPAIYGDRIVWSDDCNGNSDIYMYNLSTQKEAQITTNISGQGEPTIYGDRILWIDGRNQKLENYSILGNLDIYMFNFSTQQETQVTRSQSCKHWLSVYGDRIVWEDFRNKDWNIYMYNLSTQKEIQISTSGRAYNPAIYDDRIVWEDYRNDNSLSGNSDIYMYNLSTSKETQITANTAYQFRPAIYGERIVWEDWRNFDVDNRNGNWDIYLCDHSTSMEAQVITNKSNKLRPTIYGDRIVWEDSRNRQHNIYTYDLSTQKETQITTSGRAYSPAIYGNKIVWQDYRNGNSDIYTCTIENSFESKGSSDDDETDESSSGGSSHSSSSGGSGGGSPELAKNVQVKELSQAFIASGKPVKFDFPKNATCVVFVSFDAKKTFGKTTAIAEQLKEKSALVSGSPEGEVYNFFNIWVGNGGVATSKNIENPVVCFKVEKSWVKDKKINPDSITLNRYSDKKGEQFPVNLSGEDNKYLYFTAKTSGFSSFAITGTAKPSSGETVTGIQLASTETINKNNTSSKEPQKEQKEILKTPGFKIYYGIASLLAVILYKRK